MSWDFTIAPLLSWPLLRSRSLAVGLAFIVIAVGDARAAAGSCARWRLPCCSLPSSIRVMRNEDRENLCRYRRRRRRPEPEPGALAIARSAAERALNDLKQAVARLGNTELRVVTVTLGMSRPTMTAPGCSSALNQALAEVPPERFAGAVLITDGQVHDVPGDIEAARPRRAAAWPAHRQPQGDRPAHRHRTVAALRHRRQGADRAFPGRGHRQRAGGRSASTVRLGNGEDQNCRRRSPARASRLPVMVDHGGQNITEIVADPLPGEITEQNNRAIAVIEGIRDRLRVLLVSGEPHPGERTWRNLLKADASVDLVHFTILRPPEKQDGTPIKELSLIAFPTRELFVEKLDEFDLIIFDRYQRQRHPADGLSRQYRRLCEARRRGADRRRAGLCRRRRPLQHAAQCRAAGRAFRPGARRAHSARM